jgi:hypothetical protein
LSWKSWSVATSAAMATSSTRAATRTAAWWRLYQPNEAVAGEGRSRKQEADRESCRVGDQQHGAARRPLLGRGEAEDGAEGGADAGRSCDRERGSGERRPSTTGALRESAGASRS